VGRMVGSWGLADEREFATDRTAGSTERSMFKFLDDKNAPAPCAGR
jgi:hypothetical protein